MEITEVRIKLMENSEDRLRAFCSITFDDSFVVRDLKIIEGNNGPFVAMPSRKLTSHCRECHSKNHLRARFCNQCGKRLGTDHVGFDQQGRAKLYADIAHPINARCREQIQDRVIGEFFQELERAKQPGYVSRYDDDYEDDRTWEHADQPKPHTSADAKQKSAAKDKEIAGSSQTLKGPHKSPTDTTSTDVGAGDDSTERKDGFGRGIFE